jgi:hypothetical protein
MPSYTFSHHARMCSSYTAERAEGESTMRGKKEAASERETRRTRFPAKVIVGFNQRSPRSLNEVAN